MVWSINRTIQDVMLDHKCPVKVTEAMETTERASLEFARQQNSSNGIFGVYEELQDCFGGNAKLPGYFAQNGAGKFIIDIGLGYDAQETRWAVDHGFVVLSIEMLPSNVRLIKKHTVFRNATGGGARWDPDPRYQFVELQQLESGQWVLPDLPQPPSEGGFAYIINAAVADEEMTVRFDESMKRSTDKSIRDGRGEGKAVPVLPLHKLLPTWFTHAEFLKIDTQGFELKVLRGCEQMLRNGRILYVTFEFSPWLMKRAHSGDPQELLQLMPSMGALCYTASPPTEHLRHGAPWDLQSWYQYLDGANWTGWGHPLRKNDPWGPWVDILCYWPFDLLSSAIAPVGREELPTSGFLAPPPSSAQSLAWGFPSNPLANASQIVASSFSQEWSKNENAFVGVLGFIGGVVVSSLFWVRRRGC